MWILKNNGFFLYIVQGKDLTVVLGPTNDTKHWGSPPQLSKQKSLHSGKNIFTSTQSGSPQLSGKEAHDSESTSNAARMHQFYCSIKSLLDQWKEHVASSLEEIL